MSSKESRADLLRPVDPPIVESDEDCRHSADCRDDGRCKHGDGRCVVGSWEDCKASAACSKEGRCYLEAGECRPITEEHCLQAEACTEHGRCVLDKGRCTYPADYCRNRTECLDRGACTMRGDRCVAGDDRDCVFSALCAQQQLCYAKNGACVALPGLLPNVGGKVTFGKPAVNGKLTADAVESGSKAASEPMLGCHQRALVANSELRAKLPVRFVIGRDGTAAKVSRGPGSTLRDERAATCILKAVETAKLPAPESGIVTVSISVQLEP